MVSQERNVPERNFCKATIGSNHHPMHLLCKSRAVEALDRSNLDVLYRIENSVKQREMFETINPSLKSFSHGKETVVEGGIEALISLVSDDKSGKSCSQHKKKCTYVKRDGKQEKKCSKTTLLLKVESDTLN